jgi:hypothetical protein
MIRYVQKLLHNCEETSRSIVKSESEALSFKEKMEMHVHLLFCKWCRNFRMQSNRIERALDFYFKNSAPKPLSRAFKEKLKQNFK